MAITLFRSNLEHNQEWFANYNRQIRGDFCTLISATSAQCTDIAEKWADICETAWDGWEYSAVFGTASTIKDYTAIHSKVMDAFFGAIYGSIDQSDISTIFHSNMSKADRFRVYDQGLYRRISADYTDAQRRIIRYCWDSICAQAMVNRGRGSWEPSLLDHSSLRELKEIDGEITDLFKRTIVDVVAGDDSELEEQEALIGRLYNLFAGRGKKVRPTPAGVTDTPTPQRRQVEETLADFLDMMTTISTQDNRKPSPSFEQRFKQLVSMLAFFELPSTLEIPQKINNRWVKVQYEVTKIELPAPSSLGIEASHAWGLTPVSNTQAERLLLFRGSDFGSSARGRMYAVLTDLSPVYSVGTLMYGNGKENLRDWVESRVQKVTVFGMSLGASLAFNFAHDFAERVKEVWAYAPPGQLWSPLDHQNVPVHIMIHDADPIAKLGHLPHGDGSDLVKIVTSEAPGILASHRKPHTKGPFVVLKANLQAENKRYIRKAFVVIHQLLAACVTLGFVGYKIVNFVWRSLVTLKRWTIGRNAHPVQSVVDVKSDSGDRRR